MKDSPDYVKSDRRPCVCCHGLGKIIYVFPNKDELIRVCPTCKGVGYIIPF